MNAFVYHLGYEFVGAVRDKSRLFMNYLFPLAFLLLAGALMTKLSPGFTDRMPQAMSVFAVMCAFLLSLPTGLVAARDSGGLRSFRINGVPASAALAAPSIATAAHMVLATAIIGLVSCLAFGAKAPADWPRWAAAWSAMCAATAGLGALIGVVAGSGRAATLLAQCLYLPSILLGGLMTPAGALPPALERLSLLFPARHAMRAFAGGDGVAVSIAALLLGAGLAFALAALLFEWDGSNARPGGRKLLALLAFLPYAASMALA